MNDITAPRKTTRTEVTAGLRQLADYLDTHPDIPVAIYGWDLLIQAHGDNDTAKSTELDRIAAILGVPVDHKSAEGGHYTAVRSFGPITYHAYYVTARAKAAYQAYMTYADAVIPDDPPEAA
jgi:hypothetical protein